MRLLDMGINPVYAVPGALLKKGKKIYKKIYNTGAEFINHGGREHTYFDLKERRHASCFFYEQQPLHILKQDILQGHRDIENTLDMSPKGWRTPHFGTFQSPKNLDFLYSTLNELGYQFSSSTIPEKAYKHGPVYNDKGIIEIPVTGILERPLDIMDTWAYFGAPNRTMNPSDYLRSCKILSHFSERHPILINIYGDPSHIHEKEDFFQGMEYLLKNAENINYTQILQIANENIRSI